MRYHSIVSTEPSQQAVGTIPVSAAFSAAGRLHGYLLRRHWRGDRLVGPDTGIRFNYRIGRFVKSYSSFIPWRDDLYYLQAQGYWMLSNWRLLYLDGGSGHQEVAHRCAQSTLGAQRPDGAWDYPNPEWRGRVATYEGVWASLGLLETFRRTGDGAALEGAMRWHAFMTREIGFQEFQGTLAANYFADRTGSGVPNASTDVLRFLAELAEATGSAEYRAPGERLIGFLEKAQRPTGEFPYEISTEAGHARMEHYQCYQYNAFECLGLMRYMRLTGDERVQSLVERTLRFLASGLAPEGYARYACEHTKRRVTYHAAALAACFAEAKRIGIPGYDDLSARAYRWLLDRQREDGSFPHSSRDYGLLTDARSYPRNLAMILYHLLSAAQDHDRDLHSAVSEPVA
jgi:hypothetical protein